MYNVIIIGSGPSGLTSLLYSAKYNLNALCIGDSHGGKLINAPDIVNYPAIPNIHGKEFTQNLLKQLENISASIAQNTVTAISRSEKGIFIVTCQDNTSYETSTVILATGNGKKQRENSAVILSERLGVTTVNGHIQADQTGKTNIPGVFACGDCMKFPESLEQLTVTVASGIQAAVSVFIYLNNTKPPIVWGHSTIPRFD